MRAVLILIVLLRSASSLLVDTSRTFAVRKGHPPQTLVSRTPALSVSASASAPEGAETEESAITFRRKIDRRSLLSVAAALLPATLAIPDPAAATDDSKGKIVVFGGSGYVGSHVSRTLSGGGYEVVSVSRSSPADQADRVKSILGSPIVPPVSYVSLDASTADLTSVLGGASAVVSCVGIAPGGPDQRAGNGAVNVRIAESAKAGGVRRFVYVSVASDLASGPARFLLGDYFKGKAEAEAAVVKGFGVENALIVKPAIISGGPPGEIRPPGPPGMKPASVEAVARAVVAGAVGESNGSVDGNAAILAL